MSPERIRYLAWLRTVKVGEIVLATGNLAFCLHFDRSRIACHLKTKSAGVTAIVEKVSEKSVRVMGKYFNTKTGFTSAGHPRYRMQIFPLFYERNQNERDDGPVQSGERTDLVDCNRHIREEWD